MRKFVKTSIIGGLLVISPTVIIFLALQWGFQVITQAINPLATIVLRYTDAPTLLVDMLVLLMMILTCFIVGSIVATSTGKWLHQRFDRTLAKLAPGYNLVRDILTQLFGDKSNSPFTSGEVARVQLFGANTPTQVTGIVTSRHHDNWITLFVPTGPNPTSGMIYHLPPDLVEILPDIKVEDALRTIIACGAGTGEMFNKSVSSPVLHKQN